VQGRDFCAERTFGFFNFKWGCGKAFFRHQLPPLKTIENNVFYFQFDDMAFSMV
jgi:hypothetical protein